VVKIAGFIGVVVGFLFPFVVSDHIDWLADNTSSWSDYLANAIGVVFAVAGWFLGTWIARRVKTHFARSHTLAH
jgi:hypothetical protein